MASSCVVKKKGIDYSRLEYSELAQLGRTANCTLPKRDVLTKLVAE